MRKKTNTPAKSNIYLSGNTGVFQFNTAINSGGRVDIRSADNWVVQHNWFENIQGFSVLGPNHSVIGNKFEGGAKLMLLRGNGAGPTPTGYDQIKNATVQCNVGPLRIGLDFSSAGTSFLPAGIQVNGHSGPINIQSGSQVKQNSSFSCPANKAFKLNSSQIRPAAYK